MAFVHFHTHSTASDGLAAPAALAEAAWRLGMPALALTDHQTLAGHQSFQLACEEFNIVPLLGAELAVRSQYGTGHVLVVTTHPAEYAKLTWLVRRRKAIHVADLQECGLVTSACLGGVVGRALSRAPLDWWAAYDTAREYQHALGTAYYLEVQPSFGATLPWALALSRDTGIPALVTNDVHYLEADDASRHVQTGLHLATEAELRACSPLSGYQAALEATGAVATLALRRLAAVADDADHAAGAGTPSDRRASGLADALSR